MGYTPTDWKTGDVVTSTKLNNLENGVSNAEPFIVTITIAPNEESYEFEWDKTFAEIFDAFDSGKDIYLHLSDDINNSGDVMIRRFYLSRISIFNDGERVLKFDSLMADIDNNILSSLNISIYEKQQDHVSVSAVNIPLPDPGDESPIADNAS